MKPILIALLALASLASAGDITITFVVPDDRVEAVINDLAEARGYQEKVLKDKATSSEMIDNPQSKIDFLKESIGKELIEQIRILRSNKVSQAARTQADAALAEAAKKIEVK
jgi:hypothetical protein